MGLTSWNVRVRQALVVVLFVAFSMPAVQAREGGWYVGAGAGFLKANATIDKLAQPRITCVRGVGPGITVARTLVCERSADDNDFSLSVFGGYEVNEYVAFELGFANLPGSYNVRLIDPNFPAPSVIDVQQDSRAFFLRSLFTLPMREFAPASQLLRKVSVSAVLGVSRWRSDTDLAIDLSGAGSFVSSASNRATGTSVTFGARLGYDFNDSVRLSAAWDRYRDLGDSATAVPRPIANPTLAPFRASPVNVVKDDVDVFSLNMMYRF